MSSFLKLPAAAVLGVLTACSFGNTRLLQSWTNPDQGARPLQFNKLLVMAVAPSDTERRSAEDAMATKIGPSATPSYTVLTEEELKNPQAAQARIKQASFDGVVLLRWLGLREEKEFLATPLYSPLWDHYSYSWTYMQESTVVQWKILQLETRIYSMADQKLLWSGTTETVEPNTINKLVNEVAGVVRKQLRSQGLLPPS